MALTYRPGPWWCPAVVKLCLGHHTVLVETDKSQTLMCHHDQLHSANVAEDLPSYEVMMF